MEPFEYQEYDLHLGRRERLRLRIRLNGIESLKDYEVLEFLLYYVVPRMDMNDQAHALIDRFGSVGGVLRAELKELTACGLSRGTAEWLCVIGDTLADIGGLRRRDNVYLRDLFSVLVYSCGLYRRMKSPASVQLCVDKHGRVVYQREITPSRAWGEPIVLRDALHDMISSNAKSAIILQFTGREIAEPDEYDFERAQGYSDALDAAHCRLDDVVLIGESGSASLRQLGRIPVPREKTLFAPFQRGYLRETIDAEDFGFSDYLKMTDAERDRIRALMHEPVREEDLPDDARG